MHAIERGGGAGGGFDAEVVAARGEGKCKQIELCWWSIAEYGGNYRKKNHQINLEEK